MDAADQPSGVAMSVTMNHTELTKVVDDVVMLVSRPRVLVSWYFFCKRWAEHRTFRV